MPPHETMEGTAGEIAERAVETHTTQIVQKLGLHSNAEMHRSLLAMLAYLGSTESSYHNHRRSMVVR